MPKEKLFSIIISGIVSLIFSIGCAKNQLKRITIEKIGAPEWVLKGGGIYSDSVKKAFYGVGSAADINNTALQRTASDNRARNDLAKVFKLYTRSLTEDYQSFANNDNFKNNIDEKNIEMVLTTLTFATLEGVEIIDHWENPYKNQIFSLACLDMSKLKESLEDYEQTNKFIRDDNKRRAKNLYKELKVKIINERK